MVDCATLKVVLKAIFLFLCVALTLPKSNSSYFFPRNAGKPIDSFIPDMKERQPNQIQNSDKVFCPLQVILKDHFKSRQII